MLRKLLIASGYLRSTRGTSNLGTIKSSSPWNHIKSNLDNRRKVSMLCVTPDLRVKRDLTKRIKCQISGSKITWVSNCVAKTFAQITKETSWTTASAKIWADFSRRTVVRLFFRRTRRSQRRWIALKCQISHSQITIKIVLSASGSCSTTTFPVATNMKDSVTTLKRWNLTESRTKEWICSNKLLMRSAGFKPSLRNQWALSVRAANMNLAAMLMHLRLPFSMVGDRLSA